MVLADGESAKITPEAVAAVIDPIRDGVHQVQPQAISITQASEYGCVYRPGEVSALAAFAKARGLGLHMDGARFANAVAFLGCAPVEACMGVDAISFWFVKHGGMGPAAVVFFDREAAQIICFLTQRAGPLPTTEDR